MMIMISSFGYEVKEQIIGDITGFHVSIAGFDTNNNLNIRLLNESEEYRTSKFVLEISDKYGRVAPELMTVKATLSPGCSKTALLFPLPGGFEKGGQAKTVSIKKVYGIREPESKFVVLTKDQISVLEDYVRLKKKMLDAVNDGDNNGRSDRQIMEENKFLLYELRKALESNVLAH